MMKKVKCPVCKDKMIEYYKSTKCKSCSNKLRAGKYTNKGGWKHTEEYKAYMRSRTGELAAGWKGGRTAANILARTSTRYKEWRKAVFERDNYTCVWCGDNKGNNLNADHIKPFAYYEELRYEINNGRTLCHDCHKKTDTYGRKVFKYAK